MTFESILKYGLKTKYIISFDVFYFLCYRSNIKRSYLKELFEQKNILFTFLYFNSIKQIGYAEKIFWHLLFSGENKREKSREIFLQFLWICKHTAVNEGTCLEKSEFQYKFLNKQLNEIWFNPFEIILARKPSWQNIFHTFSYTGMITISYYILIYMNSKLTQN